MISGCFSICSYYLMASRPTTYQLQAIMHAKSYTESTNRSDRCCNYILFTGNCL